MPGDVVERAVGVGSGVAEAPPGRSASSSASVPAPATYRPSPCLIGRVISPGPRRSRRSRRSRRCRPGCPGHGRRSGDPRCGRARPAAGGPHRGSGSRCRCRAPAARPGPPGRAPVIRRREPRRSPRTGGSHRRRTRREEDRVHPLEVVVGVPQRHRLAHRPAAAARAASWSSSVPGKVTTPTRMVRASKSARVPALVEAPDMGNPENRREINSILYRSLNSFFHEDIIFHGLGVGTDWCCIRPIPNRSEGRAGGQRCNAG